MNRFVNTLLRTSISASLSDRESFVDRISEIIQEKIGGDSDRAKSISDKIATAMESFDEQLLIDQLISPTQSQDNDKELGNKIDKLTEAINKLNENIEKLQR